MDRIQLGLSRNGQGDPRAGGERPSPRPAAEKTPLSGYFAVGFGLLGLFTPLAFLFVPLGLIFSIVALLRGQGGWAFAGLILAVGGFLSSTILMGLLGLGTMYMLFDWHDVMEPVYRVIGGGTTV